MKAYRFLCICFTISLLLDLKRSRSWEDFQKSLDVLIERNILTVIKIQKFLTNFHEFLTYITSQKVTEWNNLNVSTETRLVEIFGWAMENTSRVQNIIKLFENRSKKDNALRLNKPLSKSFTSLSTSEWKLKPNLYDNHESVQNIEDRLTSYLSRLNKYNSYAKETHIIYLKELVQLLVALVDVDTGNVEATSPKKRILVKSIITQFEELNRKLPTVSNNHFDFTYKPYSSVRNTSISPQNSMNSYDDRKSPEIIEENGNSQISVAKIRAIFNNASDEKSVSDLIINSNSNKFAAHLIEDTFTTNRVHMEEKAVLNTTQEINNENDRTVFPELKVISIISRTRDGPSVLKLQETTDELMYAKLDENEVTYNTDNSGSLKYFEADTHFRSDAETDETEQNVDEGTSDWEDHYLNSRNLNGITRNIDGMQNVSSLKRLFEAKSPEELPVDLNVIEAETPEELFHSDDQKLENLERPFSIAGDVENNVIDATSSNTEECDIVLIESYEGKDSLITSQDHSEEEKTNIPVLSEYHLFFESTIDDNVSSPVPAYTNEACIVA